MCAVDRVAVIRRDPGRSVLPEPIYLGAFVDCEATAFHLPPCFTKTSVQMYVPLVSLPSAVLVSVSLPVTTAVSPKRRTSIGPISIVLSVLPRCSLLAGADQSCLGLPAKAV